jgi:peroxiredoxin
MSTIDEQIKAAELEWQEGWKLGPTRIRWETPPPQVGDHAPDLRLMDMNNTPAQLSSLWGQKPLLILFWRHFGCSCGVDRAGRLQKEYRDYLSSGGHVIVIGQGEPERARAYAEKYGLPCPILCDPAFQAYDAFGLLEGTPAQILFDAPEALLMRDYSAGMKLAEERRDLNRPMVDSPWQLPGEFVIDQQGIIRLAYRYNFCEDWPDHRVLTAALRDSARPFPVPQPERPAPHSSTEATVVSKPLSAQYAASTKASEATQPRKKHGTGRLGESGPV